MYVVQKEKESGQPKIVANDFNAWALDWGSRVSSQKVRLDRQSDLSQYLSGDRIGLPGE